MQKLLIIAVALIVAVACNKKTVDNPGFTVVTDKDTYKTTDTVFFSFGGNPWFLTFYSGEPYHKYEYHDRTTANGAPQLQFTSTVQTGSQANTLRLFVSSDFSGTYDSASIYQATWTDITDKAKLATSTTSTASGIVDLTSFINNDHPVYFAFKYIGLAGSAQRNWTIKSVALNNVLPDNTSYALLNISESTSGFKAVQMKTTTVSWSVSNSQFVIKGGTTTASQDAEDWLISKPLTLNRVTPDAGVPLKNMTTAFPSYTYMYATPGTYNATFVAANVSRYDDKENVVQIPVTVQ